MTTVQTQATFSPIVDRITDRSRSKCHRACESRLVYPA